MAFACSICEEESTRICVRCTKDACGNHLCDRCKRCSDCCECEVPLSENLTNNNNHLTVRAGLRAAPPEPEPMPHPHPGPDPDTPPDDTEPGPAA